MMFGAGIVASVGGSKTYLLDAYPNNHIFGGSTYRKLRAAAATTIVRGVTLDLNTETDITIAQMNDGTTVPTLAGGTEYLVHSLYDQSTANNTPTRTAGASAFERIADVAGAQYYTTTGSYPALTQNGSSSRLDFAAQGTLTGEFTLTFVTEDREAVPLRGLSGSTNYFRIENSRLTMYINSVLSQINNIDGAVAALRFIQISRAADNTISYFINGVLQGTVVNAETFTYDRIYSPVVSRALNRQTELCVWGEDLTADATNIYNLTRADYNNDF